MGLQRADEWPIELMQWAHEVPRTRLARAGPGCRRRAATWLTVPMLAAAFAAILAANLVRSSPTYDRLQERMLDEPAARRDPGQ